MNTMKTYYGTTFFRRENSKDNIELEYYKTMHIKTKTPQYGIQIIKKEYKNNNVEVEVSQVKDVSESSRKVINIIETLKKHKVTPIGLQDVMQDLLKQKN